MKKILLAAALLLLQAGLPPAERLNANDAKDADTWDADREHVYKKLGKSHIQQRAIHREGTGVVYAAAGSPEFVRREVLPTVDYLKQLGIADARGVHASPRPHGFALFTERVLVNELTSTEKETLSNFFERAAFGRGPAAAAGAKNPKFSTSSIVFWQINSIFFFLRIPEDLFDHSAQ